MTGPLCYSTLDILVNYCAVDTGASSLQQAVTVVVTSGTVTWAAMLKGEIGKGLLLNNALRTLISISDILIQWSHGANHHAPSILEKKHFIIVLNVPL